MNHLLEKIKQKNSSAFTHSGKFHADDVFSAALLLYLNPEITITRGNQVPENYEGLVFDILAEDSMIIIRKTAVSAIMASHMRPSAFSGRSLDRKS